MSFNRLEYDNCAYKTRLYESVGPLDYMLNPMKFENCNKCRNEFGIIGGTSVSQVRGNLVNLESDLLGITRPGSLCPCRKYQPPTGNKIFVAGHLGSNPSTIDITPVHLPSCQMIRYPAIPLPNAPNYGSCVRK